MVIIIVLILIIIIASIGFGMDDEQDNTYKDVDTTYNPKTAKTTARTRTIYRTRYNTISNEKENNTPTTKKEELIRRIYNRYNKAIEQ